MIAKYDGTCRSCGGAIEAGEEIKWSRGAGARHINCGASSARYGITQEGTRAYRSNGMCEDAPCCGCCGPQGDGGWR